MTQPKKEEKKRFPYRILIDAVILLSLAVLIYRSYAPDKKIVYINTPKLLTNYKGMQDVQVAYNAKMKDAKSKADTLLAEVKAISENLQKNGKKMKKNEIAEIQSLLSFKEKQLNTFSQNVSKKLEEEDGKIREIVLKDVNSYIMEYGKKKGYTYVLGGKPDGGLLYAMDGLDVTDEVLNALNSNYISKTNITPIQ